MRLTRAIRLDTSDLQVFEKAAEPGEWAVPGSFAFIGIDASTLSGKAKIAFASGWLGTESWGRSSLVEVAEIDEAEFNAVIERLARHFAETYGAPSLVAALPAARAEVEDAANLADHKLGTLLAIEREPTEPESDGTPRFRERVRLITPKRARNHARIWDIAPDEES